MPPRDAYSPTSRTVLARTKPFGLQPSRQIVHPHAVARRGGKGGRGDELSGGTRCVSALTETTRTRGRSTAPRVRASRASAVMRSAEIAALGETRS